MVATLHATYGGVVLPLHSHFRAEKSLKWPRRSTGTQYKKNKVQKIQVVPHEKIQVLPYKKYKSHNTITILQQTTVHP